MTYLQAHKRPYQKLRQTISIAVVSCIVVAVVLQVVAPHFFSSLMTSMVRPFWRTEFSIEQGSLSSPASLLASNQELLRQVADANVRLATISAIEQENNELKALLGREADLSSVSATTGSSTSKRTKVSSKPVEPRILAAVLKHPPRAPYDELVIDIGADYHLSTTSTVYAVGDVLIGRVIDVLGTTAKVKLFSSPGEKYDVQVGPQHIPATAIGRGGGQYEVQVSRDVVVKEGDTILNPSFDDKPFGMVSSVLLDPTQPFETILFAPPVNMYQIRWVLVKI